MRNSGSTFVCRTGGMTGETATNTQPAFPGDRKRHLQNMSQAAIHVDLVTRGPRKRIVAYLFDSLGLHSSQCDALHEIEPAIGLQNLLRITSLRSGYVRRLQFLSLEEETWPVVTASPGPLAQARSVCESTRLNGKKYISGPEETLSHIP